MNTRSTTRFGSDANTTTRAAIFRRGRRRATSNRESAYTTRMTTTAPPSATSTQTSGGDQNLISGAVLPNATQRRDANHRKLLETERKLIRSCEHVILLNDKIRGLTKRYKSAREEGFKSFRYNLRIRLAAVEGVRNMYYEYARDRAEEVAELRKELYDQNVEIVTASDDEIDFEQDMEADGDDTGDEEDYFDGENIADDEENA